jgi:phosphatidylglycerophosphate synthase
MAETGVAHFDLVACILGRSSVRLWGLDPVERLGRQMQAAGVTRQIGQDEPPPARSHVLLLRGDCLFEDRTLRDLAASPCGTVIRLPADDSGAAVAAKTSAESVAVGREVVRGTLQPDALPGARVVTPATLSSAYLGSLLKAAPPTVLPIRAECAGDLERHLFDGSYKGVTDAVTKWVWPAPARCLTRWCVRLGVGPNAVTAVSFILAVLVMVLFARGVFAVGLIAAWIMTFLDTVDGKLARVTVSSTQFGHIFDHAIDLVHPPLWYIAWGYGLPGDPGQAAQLTIMLGAIVAAYVIGRLVEGAFEYYLAGFSLFTWRPLDSYFRLVTARRNPNLMLLSGSALAGQPAVGLVAVAAWTVGCTVILAIRLAQAVWSQAQHGKLHSWLEEISTLEHLPAYAKPFTPRDARRVEPVR